MTTVYTSGSWDLLHTGHLNVLQRSRALGDRLIVGVSTDKLIEEYKGCPPVMPYGDRVRIVKAIRYVDQVVRQSRLMDIRLLKRHKIDVATIGEDWRNHPLDGIEWMQQHGRMVFLPYTKGISSTLIKQRVLEQNYRALYATLQREQTAGNDLAAEPPEFG